jgi:putative endonuclease
METAYLQQISDKWHVYAIECSNGSIYIGQAKDILGRWKQHQSGNGAKWTKKYRPLRLFYYEQLNSLKDALQREKQLKTTTDRRFLKKILSGSQAGEPASELLKRISLEREKHTKSKKERNAKKGKRESLNLKI